MYTERAAWDSHWGPKHKAKRARLRRHFKKIFPRGHDTSIRSFVIRCMDESRRTTLTRMPNGMYLPQFHPEAFEYIARYGVDYTPRRWRHPSDAAREGECFANAWCLMEIGHRRGILTEQLLYVEGVAIGLYVVPMLHAWNALAPAGTIAADSTFYAVASWTRYLGVPFTREEYEEICGNRVISLFDVGLFPHVREKVAAVLARREEHPHFAPMVEAIAA
jgi:hypothetical protein